MDAQCFHVHCQAITAHRVAIGGEIDCDAFFGCSNILQFSPELHSYDNPSFTKLLITSINGGQIAVQTEGDFIISSFS